MTVKELKKYLSEYEDDTEVIIMTSNDDGTRSNARDIASVEAGSYSADDDKHTNVLLVPSVYVLI
ncbi:MAG: hypothetical protein IJ593_10610 [Lachnospiraceae bacterium]|nr:hypothetical protein [Lachnospiraceae bacterium]